jgi:hypothetical protein
MKNYILLLALLFSPLAFGSSAINPANTGNLGGFQGTNCTSYTLAIGGTTSAPTKGTIVVDEARWCRLGPLMLIQYNYQQTTGGSAGSGNYLFPLPSGYTIDTTKLTPTTTVEGSVVGSASAYNNVVGFVKAYDSSNLAIVQNGAGVTAGAFASSSVAAIGSGAKYAFTAIVPIAGWSAGGAGGSTALVRWTTETGITTSAGFGTPTGTSWKCRQESNNLHCEGFLTTGTVTAGALQLTLPTTGPFACTIDFTALPTATGGRRVGAYKALYSGGYFLNSDGGGSVGEVYTDGSTATTLYLAYQISSGAFGNATGSGIFVSSEKVNLDFSLPCTQF